MTLKHRLLQLTCFAATGAALVAVGFTIRGAFAVDRFGIGYTRREQNAHVRRSVSIASEGSAFVFSFDRELDGLPTAAPEIDGELDDADSRQLGLHALYNDVPPVLTFLLMGRQPTTHIGGLGFTFNRYELEDMTSHQMEVPSWFVIAACAMVTAITSRSLWRQRRCRARIARNLCPACAYDLRGAAHERCPECGEPVAAAAPV